MLLMNKLINKGGVKMAQSFDEKFFDDFHSFISRGVKVRDEGMEAQCSICGYYEKVMKMYLDEDMGWVHWKCIKGMRNLTRQEENFESLMNLEKLFNEEE